MVFGPLWGLLGYVEEEKEIEPLERQVHLRHVLHRQIEKSNLKGLLKPRLIRQNHVIYDELKENTELPKTPKAKRKKISFTERMKNQNKNI